MNRILALFIGIVLIFAAAGLILADDTRMIDTTLNAFRGDFNFKEFALHAKSTRSVFEPATMMLFGSGLVCLAGVARRRRNGRKKGSFSRDRKAPDLTGIRKYQDSCSV